MDAGQSFQIPYQASPPDAKPASDVPLRIREALSLLVQARDYAEALGQDLWDLAVEVQELRQVQLTNSDLRWLACKGFIEYANEITRQDDMSRQFQAAGPLVFNQHTCIVLTEAGVAASRSIFGPRAEVPPGVPQFALAPPVEASAGNLLPKWDDQRRQIRVGDVVVKEFKVPSPNQEVVLMAFEEEGWPVRIDDPLSPLPDIEPRRRLHDTIKALNRNQRHNLLRFMGDGSGEGIRWELTERVFLPRAQPTG